MGTRVRGTPARLALTLGAAMALGSVAASGAHAQDADSPVKNVMKMLGFATDLPEPPDFIVKSRPAAEPDYIPVFQSPPEPARPILGDKDLKAMRGDLDSVTKRHDAIRGAFPPSAKAVAEQKAEAKKAEAKKAREKAEAAGQ
jgi:hypothetical protein